MPFQRCTDLRSSKSQAYKLQWPLSVTEHLFICFGNYCDHDYLYYTNLYISFCKADHPKLGNDALEALVYELVTKCCLLLPARQIPKHMDIDDLSPF